MVIGLLYGCNAMWKLEISLKKNSKNEKASENICVFVVWKV